MPEKTRKPKTKKTKETSKKKDVDVSMATLVGAALTVYTEYRAHVVLTEKDLQGDVPNMLSGEIAQLLKGIRNTQKTGQKAREKVNELRSSMWKRAMLRDIDQWDKELQDQWDRAIGALE